MEKLEWLGYPMVKDFEDIFIRFGATHERDRQTDGHRMPRLCIASHGNKARDYENITGRCVAAMASMIYGPPSNVKILLLW